MNLRNIPFRIESILARLWFRAIGLRPSSRPFVSGDSFRALAHHHFEPGSRFDVRLVRSGDIVFVQVSELRAFEESVLPRIREPVVLITHNGDITIDDSFRPLADDRRILAWFAHNAVLRHHKVTTIPIGLENRNLHYNGVLRDYRRLARQRSPKATRILYAFTVGTNEKERRPALVALQASRLAEGLARVNSRTYRERLVKYCFVASPPGNGIDCHRTWEALYLGVIPIVKRSVFYESFPGLPVLFVDDWSEVVEWNEEFLANAYQRLFPLIPSCRYLSFDYWEGLIATAARQGRIDSSNEVAHASGCVT